MAGVMRVLGRGRDHEDTKGKGLHLWSAWGCDRAPSKKCMLCTRPGHGGSGPKGGVPPGCGQELRSVQPVGSAAQGVM